MPWKEVPEAELTPEERKELERLNKGRKYRRGRKARSKARNYVITRFELTRGPTKTAEDALTATQMEAKPEALPGPGMHKTDKP